MSDATVTLPRELALRLHRMAFLRLTDADDAVRAYNGSRVPTWATTQQALAKSVWDDLSAVLRASHVLPPTRAVARPDADHDDDDRFAMRDEDDLAHRWSDASLTGGY